MDSERWRLVTDLVHRAKTLHGRSFQQFRHELLELAGGDREVADEVVSLLSQDDAATADLWTPIAAELEAVRQLDAPRDPLLGQRLGAFCVHERIGQGGMGTVYRGERVEGFEQRVAIKVLHASANYGGWRSFDDERRILGRLEHPHIARIYDSGATDDGRPYLVMELVEGEPLDRFCDRRRLGIAARLGLFLQVCDAVAQTHRHLVVHRDLKPSNILASDISGIKLLDFGIARQLLDEDRTRTATPRLSLDFASPEQLEHGGHDPVTTQSDLYSLGVVLRVLLTGQPPFRYSGGESPAPFIRQVLDDMPPRASHAWLDEPEAEARAEARGSRPSTLRRRLEGDLDAIVDRCLRREPEERYSSAEALMADVRRHLEGLPVHAVRGSWSYRVGKTLRRHRLTLFATMLIASLCVALAASAWHQARERQRVAEAEARAQRLSTLTQRLFAAFHPDDAPNRRFTAAEVLDRARASIVEDLEDPMLYADQAEALARVYRDLGHLDDAIELAREVLQRRQQSMTDHPLVARALSNLGGLHFRRGEIQSAELYFRQAFDMRKRLGQIDLDLVRARNNLASVLASRGSYAEAETLFRDSFASRRRNYGEEDPRLAPSLRHLGTVIHLQGRHAEALPKLLQALVLNERLHGRQHSAVASTLDVLGEVLHALGQLDDAEGHLAEGLALRRQIFGPDHPATARSTWRFAALLLDREELATARVLLVDARRVFSLSGLDASHWERAEVDGLFGRLWAAEGRVEWARPCLDSSLRRLRDAKGEGSWLVRRAEERRRQAATAPTGQSIHQRRR